MFIQQVIEFESRAPGPPGRIRTLTAGNFLTKQKSLRNIFEWIIIYF